MVIIVIRKENFLFCDFILSNVQYRPFFLYHDISVKNDTGRAIDRISNPQDSCIYENFVNDIKYGGLKRNHGSYHSYDRNFKMAWLPYWMIITTRSAREFIWEFTNKTSRSKLAPQVVILQKKSSLSPEIIRTDGFREVTAIESELSGHPCVGSPSCNLSVHWKSWDASL
jgi:hypothetical protein